MDGRPGERTPTPLTSLMVVLCALGVLAGCAGASGNEASRTSAQAGPTQSAGVQSSFVGPRVPGASTGVAPRPSAVAAQPTAARSTATALRPTATTAPATTAARPTATPAPGVTQGAAPPSVQPTTPPASNARAVAARAPAPTAAFADLGLGVASTDVRTWQQRMAQRGWDIVVDGIYGTESRGVAIRFQIEKDLRVDGIVGVQTWNASWERPIT